MLKNLFLILLLPALCFSQQNQTLNYFSGTYLPQAQILLKDSLHLYFTKSPGADSIFKIPISEVRTPLDGVPYTQYTNWNDALLAFNKSNATGVGLELGGIGLSVIGYGILLSTAYKDDVNSKAFKTGGAIAIAGGILSVVGLVIELRSHRHLKRMDIMVRAIPY